MFAETTALTPLESLRDLETGEPMIVLAGTGLPDEQILQIVRDHLGEGHRFGHVEVVEAKWAWSPRFKNCADHDTGWACDDAGEWHRHYSQNYGTQVRTALFVRAGAVPESPHARCVAP